MIQGRVEKYKNIMSITLLLYLVLQCADKLFYHCCIGIAIPDRFSIRGL